MQNNHVMVQWFLVVGVQFDKHRKGFGAKEAAGLILTCGYA